MTTRLLARILVGAGILCLGATTAAFAQFNVYYLTHLGASGAGGRLGLNQAGEVVGTNSSTQAFLYSQQNGMQILLNGTSSAVALNDNGQVALIFGGHAQIYTRSTGQLTDLGTLGSPYSTPTAINGVGSVVGQSADSTGQFYPFLYSSLNGGPMYNMGSFGGPTPQCSANGINTGGVAVGVCVAPNGHPRAFYFSKGLKDFDPNNLNYDSVAYAMNDAGAAVGATNKVPCGPLQLQFCAGSYKYPVLFQNGTMKNLGTLAPGDAFALGINNLGDIVGWSYSSASMLHAFIYTKNTLYDLNNASLWNQAGVVQSGWVLTEADAINDRGQIVGLGKNPATGLTEIVELTPVPVVLTSLTVNPNSVVGGQTTTGVITLNRPVPPGGITITLSSNNPMAHVQGSVTILSGSAASFPITTSFSPIPTIATITASYGSSNRSASLTVF